MASNDIKKIHASSGLKNLRFSKYFDDVTRVWSNLNEETPTISFVLYTINVECMSDASYIT